MARKRVEAESEATAPAETPTTTTKILVRSKDGSAFARCEECKKNVPVALINMHSCSLDARIKMNLEAQVVETATEVKKKSAERKKPTSTAPKSKRAKKDPSKPKRPPTAFFIFMKTFKEANPGSKDVKRVAKEAGEKWKSMSDDEKKQYHDKAAELKAEYNKGLETNNAENEDDEGGSGKDDAGADADNEAEEVKDAADKELEDSTDEE
ncbi:high mobility group B protein 7-like isoform X2 [Euphorbia lathyris]|uniref:high mobility group B protein 7-like isoform X2 n=1 Tax=Euphorbia lathyris TaxID=212925 RepID=UPI003313A5DD